MDGWMNPIGGSLEAIQKPLVPDLESNETISKDRTCLLVPGRSHGC